MTERDRFDDKALKLFAYSEALERVTPPRAEEVAAELRRIAVEERAVGRAEAIDDLRAMRDECMVDSMRWVALDSAIDSLIAIRAIGTPAEAPKREGARPMPDIILGPLDECGELRSEHNRGPYCSRTRGHTGLCSWTTAEEE